MTNLNAWIQHLVFGASSHVHWDGSCHSLGIWLWRVLVSCQEYFVLPRVCCWCSPSPWGGIICSKFNGNKPGTIILSLCLQRQINWEFISQKVSGWPLAAQELSLFVKEENHGLYKTILGGRGCIQHLSLSFLPPLCNIHVSKANWFLQLWQPQHCTDLHNANLKKWTKEELKSAWKTKPYGIYFMGYFSSE